MQISVKYLKVLGACRNQTDYIYSIIGTESVEITEELCLAHSDQIDWNWAARRLLSSSARAEYDRITEPSRAEYYRITESARAEYDRSTESARAEYYRSTELVRAEYDRSTESVRAEYDRILKSARAECHQICARAFASLANS